MSKQATRRFRIPGRDNLPPHELNSLNLVLLNVCSNVWIDVDEGLVIGLARVDNYSVVVEAEVATILLPELLFAFRLSTLTLRRALLGRKG